MSHTSRLEHLTHASERIAHTFPNTQFCFIGGIITDALVADGTVIDTNTQNVRSLLADVDTIRPNGTKRDIDLIVFSTETSIQRDIKRITHESVGNEMVVSVGRQYSRSEKARHARHVLSTDFVEEDGTHTLSVGPFVAPVPDIAIRGWTLTLSNDRGELPILSPRYHELSYCIRSIGGPRPKDTIPTKLPVLRHVISAAEGLWSEGHNLQYAALDNIRDTLQDIQQLRTWGAYRKYGYVALVSKIVHKIEASPKIVHAVLSKEQSTNAPLLLSDGSGQQLRLTDIIEK